MKTSAELVALRRVARAAERIFECRVAVTIPKRFLTRLFGLVTPPYGLCLMICCAVAKVPLKYALKDTMIMLVPMLLMLAAIIIWPEIPLILPKLIAPELLK